MTHRAPFRIYALVFLLIIIWGISWPTSKIGLTYMPPIWFAASRLFIGMISLFVIVIAAGKLVMPRRRDLPIILVIGLLQMALFMILITLGLEHVNAGRSAILVYSTPIWVMPLAILFFKEKLTRYKAGGFILGMSGVLILFSPWGIDWSNKEVLFGNALLLTGAFCWAISILCARNMKWHRTPLELVPWQLLVAAVPVVLIAYASQPIDTIQWNSTLVICLLLTGIFATAFGYWSTLVISKELPSITVSLCYLAVPVAGLIFSASILHEPITRIVVSAMICILAGIACAARGSRPKKDPLPNP